MRILLISNRAPVSIVMKNGRQTYAKSSGGLASGLTAYVEKMKKVHSEVSVLWIGWPGAAVDDEKKTGAEILQNHGVKCVFLSEEVMDNFYQGFCNKTIWPLFHYFPGLAEYKEEYWSQYREVNERFCSAVLEAYRPGDVVWVHDYHLMLLPALLREKIPDAPIGFFLHIPFPSYEVFRLLPESWRKKLLEGLLGADLIGFHTHDYRTYFLRSILRILGLQHHMGDVRYNNRLVKADTFPMGIDFARFAAAAKSKASAMEKKRLTRKFSSFKRILSIDRQDYSKGILNRLEGYRDFLEQNPRWRGRVSLIMVVIPSRIGVESYQEIKNQIDALVGSINGSFGDLQWMPVVYQYRSLSFDELSALYATSDVALVTPLRDGMNLIAKEYIASRTDKKGVLILSEMAGAVEELDESLVINPNNPLAIAQAIEKAFSMPVFEQKRRIQIMQERVKNYNVFKWADDFLTTLRVVKEKQERLRMKLLDAITRKEIVYRYKKSNGRLLFLDYDGTLVPHEVNPDAAKPPVALLQLLKKLLRDEKTRIVIISGRGKQVLDEWFGEVGVELAAEHGILFKENNSKWKLLKPVRSQWKRKLMPVMLRMADKLPGSFVEEKEYSIAFHYRKCDPAFAALRVRELANFLVNFTVNMDVQLLFGDKILEVKNAGIDKGVAAMHWLTDHRKSPGFILAAGNDQTDEDMFRGLPKEAYTIRVGDTPSYARYNLPTSQDLLKLLAELAS